jgi:DNA-binding transcriptional ArsR family regulator
MRVVHLDARQLRTMAHPIRGRLLATLRADGPATATMLARALDTNTGATSYHLRQLADVGLVEEEPGRATGRERWWRAAHDMTSWQPADFDDDPDAAAAADWFQRFALRLLAEGADRWLAERHEYSVAWREAAGFSDYLLRLTPGRLRALLAEISDVVERHRIEAEPEGDADDAKDVLLSVAGFPRQADR